MILEYLFRDEERILSGDALDRVAAAWGVDLAEPTRRRLRQLVQEHAIHARWNNARKAPPSALGRSAQQVHQRKIARLASQLASLLADRQSRSGPLHTSLMANALELKLEEALRLAPATVKALAIVSSHQAVQCSEPLPRGRPSYAHWRPFIAGLAEVCAGAGGKPSTAWSHYRASRLGPFWMGVGTLDAELPADVRAPSLGGLAEYAHKHRLLAGVRAGQK